MLDHEDLKWIAATSTELNTMLQQISRYADLARQHKGEYNYIEMLGERVELASKTAQSLFDRVTSRILEGSDAKNERHAGPVAATGIHRCPTALRSGPGADESQSGEIACPREGPRRGKQNPRGQAQFDPSGHQGVE